MLFVLCAVEETRSQESEDVFELPAVEVVVSPPKKYPAAPAKKATASPIALPPHPHRYLPHRSS